MSRVTFGDFYSDYLDVNTSVVDCKKVQKIEVVPRKMVEMIMEYCEQSMKKYPHTMTEANASNIKDYAESLLKQFEEDK